MYKRSCQGIVLESLFLLPLRSRSMVEAPTHMSSSLGVGADTRLIDQNVWSMRELLTGSASAIAQEADIDAKRLPLTEHISTKLASRKLMTAQICIYPDSASPS